MKREMEIKYRKISVSRLKIHPKVQRPLRIDHARKIAENWHPVAFNPPTVIQMTSGDHGFYVIDGQHTLTAAKMVGKQMVECKVVKAKSRAEMNEIFQVINSGVMRVSALDSFTLNAENDRTTPDAYAAQILNECNLSVQTVGGASSTHTIRCASVVRESFKKLGPEKFGVVAALLEVIADGGNTPDAATVKAITEIVRLHGDSTTDISEIAEELELGFPSMKARALNKCINTSLAVNPGYLVDEILIATFGIAA